MPILVGLVLFFIMSGGLILIGYYDFRRTIPPLAGQESLKTARSTAPPINVQEPTSSPTKLKDESDRVGIARKETPAGISTERPRELIAANKVSIDLGSNNPLRSSGQTESPPIVLVSGPNQLEIKLQSGSPKGWYKVTLNDPFGNQIRPFVARAHNGTTLHANLNLKSVEPGKYLICVTRNTEVPECVPALVNAR
jgi:hypothetical protein